MLQRRHRLAAALLLASVGVARAAPEDPPATVELLPGVRVHFATREEGGRFLSAPEAIAAMSPHARALAVGVPREVTEAEVVAAERALPAEFTAEERRQAALGVAEFRRLLGGRQLPWPADLWIVKLAVRPDGNAYTVGTAVFVDPEYVTRGSLLAQNLTHELFHVLSRNAPALREALYASIGYRRCGPLQLPPSLARMNISDLDHPTVDWCTDLEVEGRTVTAFPYTYGAEFGAPSGFFRLVVAEQREGAWVPVERDGRPWLVDPRPLPSFWARIGRNTSFVIHPEEVLAENFSQILTGVTRVRNPEIHERMEAVLRARAGVTP